MLRGPFDCERAAVEKHEHGRLAELRDRFQQPFLVAGQIEPGQRRRLAGHPRRRFAQRQHDNVGFLCGGDGLGEAFIGIGQDLRALGVEKLRFRPVAALLQGGAQGHRVRRFPSRAPRAHHIDLRVGQRPDQRDDRRRFCDGQHLSRKGYRVRAVLQQDDGLLGDTTRQRAFLRCGDIGRFRFVGVGMIE